MQSSNDGDIVSGINVTPLVDVGLVLVIIFMVTAPLFEQPTLDVNLPKATTKEGEEEENITVTITSEREFAVNQILVTQEDIVPHLKQKIERSGTKHVILRADKESLHGDLLYVMRLSKELGAKSMAIATEPKQTGIPRSEIN